MSWDSWTVDEQCMNSTFCLLKSKFMCMNSMGYCSYTLKRKKKKKANAELKMWIQTDTKVWFGLGLFMSAFYSFTFLPFFFFFTRSWFHVGDRPTSGYRAQCTGPTSILDVHTLVWNGTVCGSYALFTGPTNIFFHPNFNYKWVPQHYSHI